ncbi:MAG: Stk1 family PASTA domain-containing Ser/Thr kinase [Lachnospiraceae bacterium]|nr:Stk1 family PASTA domain-containing Ser/Thr kinase [Candidatus Equihabitans merdae]
MLKAGAVLGNRYVIVGRIGSGGMADVYKAKDNKLERSVAVKVMKAEFKSDNNFVKKFTREAQAAAGLANPNIVNVFDVGDDNGVYYIVMELVEGITLKEYISKKGKLSVREATSIAIQVCMGLAAAHSAGIVHRDVKPQNIIISTDGKVKVTDFGIAKAASSNTISSNAMGSVHYSSPEQVRGGSADAKSDIYSLGITLYEMVTGRVPFDGDTTVAIAIKHLQDEMDPPSKYTPDLPYSLEQIIYKCTQKGADRRYANVDEVIEDLKHSLVDPNGQFVSLVPLSDHAKTVAMSAAEVAAIRSVSDRKSATSGKSASKSVSETSTASSGKTSFMDDDDDDLYGESYFSQDDEEEDVRPRRRSRREDFEDEDDDPTSPLEKIMTIGGFVIGAIIIVILIFFIGRAAGIFKGGNKAESVESSVTSVVESTEPLANAVQVPSIVDLTEQEAETVLTNLGLKAVYAGEEPADKDKGLIIRQDPVAGTSVEEGSEIKYYRSSGPASVAVPDVLGKPMADAQSQLAAAGFANVNIEQAASDTVAVNNVIAVTPGVGEVVDKTAIITLTISNGPAPQESSTPEQPITGEMVTISSYGGLGQDEVVSILQGMGLNVAFTYGHSDNVGYGEVMGQDPAGGTEIPQGSTVTLTINVEDPDAMNAQAAGQPTNQQAGPVSNMSCSQRLGAPSNYTNGPYKLTLEQTVNGQNTETTLAEGASIAFPYELKAQGAQDVSTGIVHLYEQVNGSYVIRANWTVPFTAS